MFNSFIFKYLSWTFCFYGFGEEEEKKNRSQLSCCLKMWNISRFVWVYFAVEVKKFKT